MDNAILKPQNITLYVTCVDGRSVPFSRFLGRYKELRRIIEKKTLKYMLPPALEAFEAGETLVFGKLQVTQEGLSNGKVTLPWSEAEDAWITKYSVCISPRDVSKPLLECSALKAPNLHVFLAVFWRVIDRLEQAEEGSKGSSRG
jgi:hypothetical protein